jgi:hypothetical protein
VPPGFSAGLAKLSSSKRKANCFSDGKRLNGKNRYTVTFTKGQLPPVNGFWSLTLYNKEHLFHPNDLHRQSLGTKSKSLKYNSDGSLTLYYQNKSPGVDKESNWVPGSGR